MRKFLPLFVVLFVFVLSSIVLGSVITQPLLERMKETKEDVLIPVNVRMKEHAKLRNLLLLVKGRQPLERREIVIFHLKEIRDRTQAQIRAYLSLMEREGKVEEVRSLWIANIVCFKATKEVIEEVAQFSEIASIDWDEERILVGPNPGIPYVPLGREIVWNVTKVRAPEVWALGFTGDSIIVSLIDTGVRYTHNDLIDHIWTNPGEIPNNNIDDDGNGYIDDYYGWDFHNNDKDPMDDYGHGTHCAGTVASDGTAGSQCGVAPDARIMSLKVLSSAGGGQESNVMEAMQYTIDNGGHIVSMSLGWSHAWNPDRPAWRNTCEALLAGGVIQSIAAGNEDNSYGPPDNVRTPGDCPPPWLHPDQTLSGGLSSVVTVGATDINDNIANFSSRGPVSWENISPWNDYDYQPGMGLIDPDISAPGVSIKSLSYSSNNGYVSGWSGTSMATPHVAGAMALMLQKSPTLFMDVIDSVLEVTSLDLGSAGKDNVFGAGRLDCYEAVEATPDPGARCSYYSHSIDAGTSGNGDGFISPYETIYVPVVVKNKGGATAKDVTANLRFDVVNSYITFIDTVSDYGDIMPDSLREGTPPYSFSVNASCPDGDTIFFEILINDSAGHDWYGTFYEVVWSPEVTFEGLVIDDSGEWRPNGILNVGETANTIISLRNANANAVVTGINTILRTTDPYITIIDSTATYSDIGPGATVDNTSSPFILYANNSLPYDHQVDLELQVTADNLVATLNFSFIAGERTNEDPTGPDDYTYWAYDMTDTLYTERPSYSWVELDPNYGGNGTELVLGDDETKQLTLPFSFMYYGTDYDTISVCSNGWIGLGVTNDASFRYYPVPDPNGPPAAVGVFWGRLDPSQAGGVYYRYDASLHAFIVQWSRVFHVTGGNEETFQVLLYDPVYNPTVTGDGEVFCQYLVVKNPANSMTGIEDESETMGLQYQLSNSYEPGAAPLADNFVCKFTTDPPEPLGIAEEATNFVYPSVFGLSQNVPNPFYGHTQIAYQIPAGRNVRAILRVYDISGKVVRTLVDRDHNPGFYRVAWDGRDNHGRHVASGVYFVRFAAGDYVHTGKMLMVK